LILVVAPGKGYNIFAGRDASKALAKSSMKPEDLSADYSGLGDTELKVLDDWLAYYTKVRLFN
jgi:membrane-associated progesterone receptor component